LAGAVQPSDEGLKQSKEPAGSRRYEGQRQRRDAALKAAALHLNLEAESRCQKGGRKRAAFDEGLLGGL